MVHLQIFIIAREVAALAPSTGHTWLAQVLCRQGLAICPTRRERGQRSTGRGIGALFVIHYVSIPPSPAIGFSAPRSFKYQSTGTSREASARWRALRCLQRFGRMLDAKWLQFLTKVAFLISVFIVLIGVLCWLQFLATCSSVQSAFFRPLLSGRCLRIGGVFQLPFGWFRNRATVSTMDVWKVSGFKGSISSVRGNVAAMRL